MTGINSQKPTGKTMSKILPYLFIAPVFITIIVFTVYPVFFGVAKSFYRYGGIHNEFIGLANYKEVLTDKEFWYSMFNVLRFWMFMNVCFCFPILAAKLTYNIKNNILQGFVRVLFLLPLVVPNTVIQMLWKFVYYPEIGVLANIFELFGKPYPDFLWNPKTTFWAICMVGFPWITGLNYIIYFTGLNSIDPEMTEAARLDGAKGFKLFTKIELPMIMKEIKIFYVMSTTAQLTSYESILLLTKGGPNNVSMVPGLYMYNLAFNSIEPRQGYSCAVSMVLFVIVLFVSRVVLKERNSDEE